MAGNEDDKDKTLAEKAYEAAASSAGEKGKTPEAAAKPESAATASDPKPSPTVKAAPESEPANKPKDAPAPEAKPVAPAKVTAEAKVAPAPNQSAPKAAAKAAPTAKTPTPVKAAALPKAKRVDKPKVTTPKPSKTPVATAKPTPVATAKPVPVAAAKPVPVAAAKPTPVATAKPAPVAPVAAAAKPAAAEPKSPVFKAAPKTAEVKTPIFAGLFTNFMLEEKTMDMSSNFNGIQDAVTEAQEKAKAAFEKSTAMLGEVSDFAKGNVEAVMESGKILAEGVQGIGSDLVAEGRSAFEIVSSDIKELAAAKSPTDFFKIQGDMMRKNFDSAVAYGSKNSEAMLKLMSDVIAPISGRVSLAMEKARQTSL